MALARVNGTVLLDTFKNTLGVKLFQCLLTRWFIPRQLEYSTNRKDLLMAKVWLLDVGTILSSRKILIRDLVSALDSQLQSHVSISGPLG